MNDNQRGATRSELESLAQQGDADSQNRLGIMHEQGAGVPADYAAAVKWYFLAADQGHSDAQNNLGRMYSEGKGVPKDDAAALRFFLQAAAQGHEIAQFNVGNIYYEGRGVPVDKAEALRWYTLSAERGDPPAQVNLGVMYLKGEGVPQNFAHAMNWLTLACANGDERAMSVLVSARRAGFEWLGAQPRTEPGKDRILYLRAFMGAEVDCTFIMILALPVSKLGRLVIIGTRAGEAKLRARWTNELKDYSFDETLEYIVTDADSWRAIAYDQVSKADCIVVHPSPAGSDYPSWQPSAKKVDSVADVYQDPIEDPATGMGLLRELSYIESFDMMSRTLLFCEEHDYRQLSKLISIASAPPGDVFIVSRGGLRTASAKIGSLNRKLGALANARSVVTFQEIEMMDTAPWICLRLEASILQILGEGRTQPREKAEVHLGVSDTPRRLPPDNTLKVLPFTRVEDLIYIPYGEITEINPEELYKILSEEAVKRGCPYCYAQVGAIFFYIERAGSDVIRGKCQRCGRRSTVTGDMLLDV